MIGKGKGIQIKYFEHGAGPELELELDELLNGELNDKDIIDIQFGLVLGSIHCAWIMWREPELPNNLKRF